MVDEEPIEHESNKDVTQATAVYTGNGLVTYTVYVFDKGLNVKLGGWA